MPRLEPTVESLGSGIRDTGCHNTNNQHSGEEEEHPTFSTSNQRVRELVDNYYLFLMSGFTGDQATFF